ncbi:MAG: leucine-rich repeat domain-containing protein, partial [Holosporales bacterium]|nr:leucine-rich repeat domain-containing protein [Holosporales bacterium]
MTRRIVKLAMLSANYVFCVSCIGGDDRDYSAQPPFTSLYVSSGGVSYGRGCGSSEGKGITVTELSLGELFRRWNARDRDLVRNIIIGAGITSIPEHFFGYMNNLQSVTFEEKSQVTDIGASAFSQCRWLHSLHIPSSVQTIGEHAFYDCKDLSAVTFERKSNLREIGAKAFEGTNITYISIPPSVIKIDMGAFSYCHSLNNITFEQGCRITEIWPETFFNCNSLQEIELPPTVQKIDICAFRNSGLTSITIPPSVTEIGKEAFCQCRNLAMVFAQDSHLNRINDCTFNECNCLYYITIPKSVESIGQEAFARCFKLGSVIFEDESQLKTIESYAFAQNYPFAQDGNTIKINVPASVKEIGPGAFSGTKVDLSMLASCIPQIQTQTQERLRIEGTHAFLNSMFAYNGAISERSKDSEVQIIEADGSVTVWRLMDTVTQKWGFYKDNIWRYIMFPEVTPDANHMECYGDGHYRLYPRGPGTRLVRIIYFGAINEAQDGQDEPIDVLEEGALIVSRRQNAPVDTTIIPSNALKRTFGNAFENHWSCVNGLIGTSITEIEPDAFRGSRIRVVNCEAGSRLTEIGERAFMDSTLSDIQIPRGVLSIHPLTFAHSMLSSITFEGDTLQVIGEEAFRECDDLRRIEIPRAVTTIGKQAFCRSHLESIKFHRDSALREIGWAAFARCKLGAITIPARVTVIGPGAFSSCPLSTVTFQGNSLTTIWDGAFYGCNIRSITIPSGVQYIGDSAFANCGRLNDVTIPSGVQYIMDSAFANCSELYDVTIPPSVQHIGSKAFAECTNLHNVIIQSNVQGIQENVFCGCTGLVSIDFGSILASFGSAEVPPEQ